jgi:hypothetical protein
MSMFDVLPLCNVPDAWIEFIAQASDDRKDRRDLVRETLDALPSWAKSPVELGSDEADAVHAIAYCYALQQLAVDRFVRSKSELDPEARARGMTFAVVADAGGFDPHAFDPKLLATKVPPLCDHSWGGLLASLLPPETVRIAGKLLAELGGDELDRRGADDPREGE